jgi:acyl transferase domain-containing protein
MDGLRRVSINCFGFGGTNAHIILDDAFHYLAERNLDGKYHSVNLSPPTTPSLFDFGIEVPSQPSDLASNETPVPPAQRHKLYALSSHEESGISRLCAAYSLYLEEKYSPELYDDELEQLGSNLVYTLCCRRSKLPWKSFLVSPSVAKLPSQFEEDFWTPVRSSQTPNIAFIFSGQGAQWFGMGRELLRFERFSKSLEEADGYMKAIGSEWSLQTEFLKDEDTSIINLP